MTKDEFKKIVENIFLYFQKAPPKSKAVDLWFQRVNWIPHIAAKWIARRIVDNESSAPYNVAKAFLDGFLEYRKAHPHLFIDNFKRTECSDCHGSGFLFFKVYNEDLGRTQRCMARCKNCENWRRHLGSKARIPAYSLNELKQTDCEIL
jgi:hypothetical protein